MDEALLDPADNKTQALTIHGRRRLFFKIFQISNRRGPFKSRSLCHLLQIGLARCGRWLTDSGAAIGSIVKDKHSEIMNVQIGYCREAAQTEKDASVRFQNNNAAMRQSQRQPGAYTQSDSNLAYKEVSFMV